MATSTTFGSITITDITDIGEFSVYPMSNNPLTVVYDPDQATFTPDWTSNNLVLTPIIYLGGTQLSLATEISAGRLSIVWKRREGISPETSIDPEKGETVNNGVLTVSKNQFNTGSTMLTYSITATYIDESSGIVAPGVTAAGQISFTLVKQAGVAKTLSITGNNVFKYNTNGELISDSSILLTANFTGLSNPQWQVFQSDWVDIPGATSTTYTVNATDTYFVNDIEKIRVRMQATEGGETAYYYDYINIYKIRDGAAGGSTIAAVLSNEDQMIPCDSDGHPTSFVGAETTLIIYEGGQEATGWTYLEPTEIEGIDWTWNSSTHTLKITGWDITKVTEEILNITLSATKDGETLSKVFSLVRVKTGADGKSPTIYSLELDSLVINKTIDSPPVISPNSITLNAYKQTGDEVKQAYLGSFVVTKYDGETSQVIYQSQSAESSKTLTNTQMEIGTNTTRLVCELYQPGHVSGAEYLLDKQTIAITSDGQTGEEGKSALTLVCENYADVIPSTAWNNATYYQSINEFTITVPFTVYEGTVMQAVNCVTSPTLFGVTPTIKNGTTTEKGFIKWVVSKDTVLSNLENIKKGTVSLSFEAIPSYGGVVKFDEIYNWTLSPAAIDGVDSVLFQLSTPQGYVFTNGEGTLTITASLIESGVEKIDSASKQWYKFNTNSSEADKYDIIPGETGNTLTVSGSTVDGYASYKCVAVYDGKNYKQYSSLMDKSDPLQCTIFSTLGNQLLNGMGVGALYCKVYRNNSEVDALDTEKFVSELDPNATLGTKVYYLDEENKSVTLKQKSSIGWDTIEESYTGTYTWTFFNKDGEIIESLPLSTKRKVAYIDGSLVDKKITANIQVNY